MTVSASCTYLLEAHIRWQGGDGVSDMNWGWTTPASASGAWVGYAGDTNMSAIPSTMRNIDSGITSPRAFGGITTATGVMMRGILRTSGAGTFGAEWSSQTAGGLGVTVLTDSWIRLQRVE
jgi:hypothetical protein